MTLRRKIKSPIIRGSAFCEACGHFVGRLSPGQKRILAAIADIEEEETLLYATAKTKAELPHRFQRAFPAKTNQIMDRTSLSWDAIKKWLRWLRDQGFIEGRKEYMTHWNVYRLSKRTRDDLWLMNNIALWREKAILKAHDVITLGSLAQEREGSKPDALER